LTAEFEDEIGQAGEGVAAGFTEEALDEELHFLRPCDQRSLVAAMPMEVIALATEQTAAWFGKVVFLNGMLVELNGMGLARPFLYRRHSSAAARGNVDGQTAVRQKCRHPAVGDRTGFIGPAFTTVVAHHIDFHP
jgi:hypothetical protein